MRAGFKEWEEVVKASEGKLKKKKHLRDSKEVSGQVIRTSIFLNWYLSKDSLCPQSLGDSFNFLADSLSDI